MIPKRLPNGNLLIPKRAESAGVIGDGMIEAKPGSKEYSQWEPFVSDKSPNNKAQQRKR